MGLKSVQGDEWREERRQALHILRDFGMGKNIMEEQVPHHLRSSDTVGTNLHARVPRPHPQHLGQKPRGPTMAHPGEMTLVRTYSLAPRGKCDQSPALWLPLQVP